MEVTGDTTYTSQSVVVGDFVQLGYLYYEVIKASDTRSPLVNQNNVRFVPAQDTNIHIFGNGETTVLDGNGRNNRDVQNDVEPWRSHGILLCGVTRSSIRDLTIKDSAMYGISLENGCCYMKLHDIHFDQPGWSFGEGIPNQDGIDLRFGCYHVSIRGITGWTGDYVIALTALHPINVENYGYVSRPVQLNQRYDFHGAHIRFVTISDIKAIPRGSHHTIRLLTSDDREISDVTIRDVHDSTTAREVLGNEYGVDRAEAVILIGDKKYGRDPSPTARSISNVRISNVSGLARHIIQFKWSASRIFIDGISTAYLAEYGPVADGTPKSLLQNLITFMDGTHPTETCVVQDLILDGAQTGNDVPLDQSGAPSWKDVGSVVEIRKNVEVRRAAFNNVQVFAAQQLLYMFDDAKADKIAFTGWNGYQIGLMGFRVKAGSRHLESSGAVRSFFSRRNFYLDHPAENNCFYSTSQFMTFDRTCPEVTVNDIVPTPVLGSELTFDVGALGSNTQKVLARGNGSGWDVIRTLN
ncbi:hypothetical protein [Thalassococcus sp. S3]|uniref:hypothetical protein n=1 Tax=Thalassococcus sp. S3 TaxID=2017482 RepID=UPI0010240E51|nr:hypothetical protein [Thalassococcus sp. S3]QBF31236.1 hypothetical protein CFI11_08400 [Thalassococcus sp. S3]